MAPPPPPSVNLLRALRALTTIRPVLPTQTRRNLYYKPSALRSSAVARQHVFHRSLHLPRPVHGYRKLHTTTYPSAATTTGHPNPIPPLQPKNKALPILPSPQLLARRFHTRQRLSSPSPSLARSPTENLANASSLPTTSSSPAHDRGPVSSEATQTNFPTMDMLSTAPPPTSAIDACLDSGFHLNNGIKIHKAGVLIVGGEAFAWTPWNIDNNTSENDREKNKKRHLLNTRGQWDAGSEDDGERGVAAWGILDLVWPKPDLIILGLGPKMAMLAPGVRARLNAMGMQVEVQDTRNAAAQFNLLATERGVGSVAAALVPIGWVEGRGC